MIWVPFRQATPGQGLCSYNFPVSQSNPGSRRTPPAGRPLTLLDLLTSEILLFPLLWAAFPFSWGQVT